VLGYEGNGPLEKLATKVEVCGRAILLHLLIYPFTLLGHDLRDQFGRAASRRRLPSLRIPIQDVVA